MMMDPLRITVLPLTVTAILFLMFMSGLSTLLRNGATTDLLTYDDAYTDGIRGEQYVGAEA